MGAFKSIRGLENVHEDLWSNSMVNQVMNLLPLDFQMSDWDRFAAEEYELLVAEEGNAEGMDDM